MSQLEQRPDEGWYVVGPPNMRRLVKKVADEQALPFLLDPDCPPGSIYTLNADYETTAQTTAEDQ